LDRDLGFYDPKIIKSIPEKLKSLFMQIKKTLVRLLLILLPAISFAQTTYLHQGDKANILMERLEIKSKSDSFFNFSKTKPFTRRHVVNAARHYQEKAGATLSKVDAYNLRSIYLNNTEYLTD
jgi:hypothetical protein